MIFLTNSVIFFTILILFPLNIPFTDTYNELNSLFSNNIKDYILLSNSGKSEDGFLFSMFRENKIIVSKALIIEHFKKQS